ncbi:dnaJ homolog subfamily B member 4-like [Drosophila rhopaloa]|uniref:DnaJ homolog subfamily B member 4-like n=1 Tax=Drosophila rhopaloa TaxID=1041015 RepID=A0A6P4F3W6_DRORH|nr:dnaJ homolog subfamily B member 4-like [Drosophila rhopaloa]
MEQDHYMILGLAPSATGEDIVKAYRRMAIIYHPDKNGHPQTEEYFKKIKLAFEVLSDEDRRAKYDLSLRNRNKRPAGTHNYQQNDQAEAPDFLPAICAIGGILVGAFMGFSAFRAFNGSNQN